MMNSRFVYRGVALAAFIFLVATVVTSSPGNYKLKLLQGSRIWVEGDSTLHEYKTTTRDVTVNSKVVIQNASPEIEKPILSSITSPSYNPLLEKLTVIVPVEKFDSKTVGFDGRFNKTLKYKDHPDIVFRMSDYTVTRDKKNEKRFFITIDGILTVAGKDKAVKLDAVAIVNNQSAKLTGKHVLKMTDFNIDPPKLIFVTTDNKVIVKWELLLTIIPTDTFS